MTEPHLALFLDNGNALADTPTCPLFLTFWVWLNRKNRKKSSNTWITGNF